MNSGGYIEWMIKYTNPSTHLSLHPSTHNFLLRLLLCSLPTPFPPSLMYIYSWKTIDKNLTHFGDALCKRYIFFYFRGVQLDNRVNHLGNGKIHDKLIRIGVAHLTSMSTKQCGIRSFFVFSERSLPNLNETLWWAIFVTQAVEFDFTF